MRILHVILSKGFTGAERSAVDTCNYQAQAHDTGMVVRWRQGRRRAGGDAAIRAYLDPRVRLMAIPRRTFAFPALRWRVASFRPDVIHVHLEEAARLVGRLRTSAARVVTLHMDEFDRGYLPFDGVICVARWQEQMVPPEFRGRVFHWSSAFAPHPRLAPERIAALRREFGAGPDDFLIGGVGSLIRRKGWDTLLRAFRAAKLPDTQLVVIGEGRDRAELEPLLSANARLVGFRSDVKDCYQAFDLFVCPSRRETGPLVLLEAFDAGLPVVVSDAPGCREMAQKFYGDVFAAEDVGRLAELLRQHHARHRQLRPARIAPDMHAHYLPHSSAALLRIYDELLGARAVTGSASARL